MHVLHAKLNHLLSLDPQLRSLVQKGQSIASVGQITDRSVRVALANLRDALRRFLLCQPQGSETQALVDPAALYTWMIEQPVDVDVPSEVDVLRVRHLVRFWVSYEADREDITARMLRMKDALAKFKPDHPIRIYRNERKQGEAGWKEQYDFATAWSTDIYDAKVFGDVDRRLVTAVAQPGDILVYIPMVEAWAKVYELGKVDVEWQDEAVVGPHPSFEKDRQEIPDDVELAEIREGLREPVLEALKEEVGEEALAPNALAEVTKVIETMDEPTLLKLEEQVGKTASSPSVTLYHGTTDTAADSILANGFTTPEVYLTNDEKAALRYGGAPSDDASYITLTVPKDSLLIDFDGGITLGVESANVHNFGRTGIPDGEGARWTIDDWLDNWGAFAVSREVANRALGVTPHPKTAAPKLPDLQTLIDEFVPILDPENQYPKPQKVSYVNRANVDWLGINYLKGTRYATATNVVLGAVTETLIQRGLGVDLNHLRKVVAHELCHHYEWCLVTTGKSKEDASVAIQKHKENSHSTDWMVFVDRINAVYGPDFVTKTSDLSQLGYEGRSVYVAVVQIAGRKYPRFMWDHTVPDWLVDDLKEVRGDGDTGHRVFIFKTNDRNLIQPHFKAAKGAWNPPQTQAELDALENLITNGQNLFAEMASGTGKAKVRTTPGWTLVMVKQRRGWINGWVSNRPLTSQDKKLLGQWVELEQGNRELRIAKVPGNEQLGSLKKALGKFSVDEVVYRPGLPATVDTNADWCQELLHRFWAQGEVPKAAKVSKFLQPKTVQSGMQDGALESHRKLGPCLSQDSRVKSKNIEYVKVYRAVPAGVTSFKDMDYCTLSLNFAQGHADHGAAVDEEPYHVIMAVLPVGWIYEAYNPGEYFFHAPKGRSTKGKVVYMANPDEDNDPKGGSRSAKFLQPKESKVVFHGTPHDFEEFKLEHLGSGEGGQSYGWGLYFTDTHVVADGYRKALSVGNNPQIERDIDPALFHAVKDFTDHGTIPTVEELQQAYPSAPIAHIRYVVNQATGRNMGRVFEVEIPDGPYLLWDAGFREQSPEVRKALKNAPGEMLQESLQPFENTRGEGLYFAAMRDQGSKEAASKLFRSLGIKGIQYLDGNSRAAGEGSYNYVIFDDKDVKVLKKSKFLQPKTASSKLRIGQDVVRSRGAIGALHRYGLTTRRILEAIAQDPYSAVAYADNIQGGRWSGSLASIAEQRIAREIVHKGPDWLRCCGYYHRWVQPGTGTYDSMHTWAKSLASSTSGDAKTADRTVETKEWSKVSKVSALNPTVGFNVNDSQRPWTQLILSGQKTIETRDSDSLRPHVGEVVGIVRTGVGPATLVATCTLGEPKVYRTNAEFRQDNAKHQIPNGPEWDLQPGAVKYGYPLEGVQPAEEARIESQGRVWRRLATADDDWHLYLDSDGVIADYEAGADAAGIPYDDFSKVPGSYRHLPVLPGAAEAIATLQNMAPGRLRILSKPSTSRFKESCIEKREWYRENFPSIPPSHILLVLDKGAVVGKNDIAVDDHPEWSNLDKSPGTVITFTGPETWEKVFRLVSQRLTA